MIGALVPSERMVLATGILWVCWVGGVPEEKERGGNSSRFGGVEEEGFIMKHGMEGGKTGCGKFGGGGGLQGDGVLTGGGFFGLSE